MKEEKKLSRFAESVREFEKVWAKEDSVEKEKMTKKGIWGSLTLEAEPGFKLHYTGDLREVLRILKWTLELLERLAAQRLEEETKQEVKDD